MFEAIFSAQGAISLFTLTLMEIILGIDNIIFISIIADKLPKDERPKARNIGLLLALVVRISLLFGIAWIIGLDEPLFHVDVILKGIGLDIPMTPEASGFSGKDIILMVGGLFLMAKSTSEIHSKIELADEENMPQTTAGKALGMVILQIVFVDIVFSFDSILTAIGLVKNVSIMMMAVIISMLVMMLFIKNISDFINEHPSLKVLALSFLIMIGLMLVIESLGLHVPKGYIYFAMAFSFTVELINMRLRKNAKKKVEHA